MSRPFAFALLVVIPAGNLLGIKETPMPSMTIELPPDVNGLIATIAKREGTNKIDVVRRTFAILKVAERERAKGNELAIVDGDKKLVARLVGVCGTRTKTRRKRIPGSDGCAGLYCRGSFRAQGWSHAATLCAVEARRPLSRSSPYSSETLFYPPGSCGVVSLFS